MELIRWFFENVYQVEKLVQFGGILLVVAIIYSETGLMLGFFLPGDSLLVTAGIFAARGDLDIYSLCGFSMLAAVLGDATGYWIGYKVGKPLYRRKQTFFFRRDHLLRTKEFYDRHGGATIVIARFVPIVRTFAPVVAGIAQMKYRRFFSFNVWGGIGWVGSMCLGGYLLGNLLPPEVLSKKMHLVIGGVIFLSLIPIFVEMLRNRGKKKLMKYPRKKGGK